MVSRRSRPLAPAAAVAALALLAAAALPAGCAHAPEFRRAGTARLSKLVGSGSAVARVALVHDRGFAFPGVEEALLAAGATLEPKDPEYTVSLYGRTRGSPRGWNFLISWPGFVVFAPAWHGLMWTYEVTAVARVRDRAGRVLPEVRLTVPYDVYHTSEWQGVLINTGWFLYYGAPAALGGIITSVIDPDLETLDDALPDGQRRAIGGELGRALVDALEKDARNLAALRAREAKAKGAAPRPVAPAAPGKGGLRVVTDPAHARVFVDDLYVGDAPVECSPRPGKHRIVLSLPGHLSVYAEVEVGAEPLVIERKLRPVPRR